MSGGGGVLDALLVATVLLPAVSGAGLLLVPGLRGAAAWVGVAVLSLTAAASVPVSLSGAGVATDFVAGASLGLDTSGPATVLLPTVLVVATCVLLAATAAGETRESRFVGLMLLFVASAVVTVLATSLPTLLLGWEVMGATSYALIGYRYTEARRVASGATAFLTTRAADLGLYLAAAAALAGGTDLALDSLPGLATGWRDVAAAGILLAALGKAAQLPFSFWLARAMDGPSPVSALLHSAAMVALGGYLLVRVSPLLAATGWADDAAAWTGVVTAVVLGAVAVAQTDLKQLLAASTSAQLGFVVLSAGVAAGAAGTAHLVAHAAVKALLFLAAGAWLEALGTQRLGHLSGAARRWPAVGLLAAVALLALAGLPPLSMWWTKDVILAAALAHSPALYAAGLVATGLAAAYATRVLVVLVLEPPGDDAAPEESIPPVVPGALLPLAAGALVLGVLALPPVLSAIPSGGTVVAPKPWELVASGGLVVVALLLVVRLGRRRRLPGVLTGVAPVLGSWLHLESATHRTLVRPLLRAAELAARVDDAVVARGVQALAGRTLATADRAAAGDDGLAAVARGVGTGARRLGTGVRRSAVSGQLHHYYLQLVAVVLLAVATTSVVLLVGSPR